jgi:hypothetical protein
MNIEYMGTPVSASGKEPPERTVITEGIGTFHRSRQDEELGMSRQYASVVGLDRQLG